MKKNIYIIIVAINLMGFNSLIAQITFKELIKGYYAGALIQPVDSNYYILDRGNILDCIKLNPQGSVIQHKRTQSVINPWIGDGLNNFFTLQNNNLFSIIDENYSSGVGFCFFSLNLSSSTINWYLTYNKVGAGFINMNNENSFFISTASGPPLAPYNYYPTMVYIDSVGGIVNSYLFTNSKGIAKCTYLTSDKKIISGLNQDTIGLTLAKYDTLGVVFWAKSYFRPRAAIHSVIQNSDGTLTILGSPDTVSSWQNGGYYHTAPLFLMTIDTAGTVLWCKSYGDNNYSFTNLPIAQLKASSDGGYLICATIQNKATIDNDLIIIKTDANGDTLWTRTHGSSFSDEFGNDISETSDGGYIVAGYTNSTFQFSNGGYYIIKTDSLGMTATHCEEFNTPFAVNNITPNDSNITLSIITGVVTAGSSTVTDTTLALPPSVDGCMLNTINQPQGSYYNSKALSYPNPAQGNFKIKGTGNTAYKLTVTVYDTLGKQLFEKQYNSNDDVQIDLNNRGKGVYSVRIVDGKNTKWSKVVVE